MKKRGFAVGACIGALLFGGISAGAADLTAKLSKQPIYIDGERAWDMTAYDIGGNNYVKLRDIGMSVGFDVSYDAGTDSVHIDPTIAYRGSVETYTMPEPPAKASAKVSKQPIYVQGKRVEVTAYDIGGSNYLKLRDLGTAVGFGVTYDAGTDSVHIDPTTPYRESIKNQYDIPASEPVLGTAPDTSYGYDSEEDALDAIFKQAAEETAKAQAQQNSVNNADTQSQEDAVQAVFKLVNEAREAEGVAPLVLDADLCRAAEIRAKELETLSSHTRPDGRKFSSVLDDNSILWLSAGENIAAGQDTAEEVMQDWMNGSHKENILNSKFVKIGIAKYQNQQNQEEWVQLFIK